MRLFRAVRRGVADGSVRSDVDPTAAGAVLMALLRGTGLQLIATPPVDDTPALTREAVQAVRRAFAGTPQQGRQ